MKILKKEIERYISWLRAEEKSEATIEKYRRDILKFAEFVGADRVEKASVMAYKAKLKEKYTNVSANSMLAALNSFLKFLGRGELCVRQLKIQKTAFCPEEKELTREEYISLVNAAEQKKNIRLSLLLQAVCATGIRISELKYITVEAVRHGVGTVTCKGKSRDVFIISGLRKKLLRYARAHGISTGSIFITRGGKPLDRTNIWHDMKKLCHAAGVMPSKVFPHNLRHLFARTFYKIEKDIAKLADILGHSNINTTRIYTVSSGAEHRRKVERMHLIL